MALSAWEAYVGRWTGQVPPLRPHADSVEAIARVLQARPGNTLLLGVTPELAGLDRQIIAVDWAKSALSDIWPGDTPNRHAMLGDWRALPIPSRSVGSVMGDGSLNVVRWPNDARAVIDEIDRVLADKGIAVLRTFVACEDREAVDAICDDVQNGREPSFAAAKWRLGMALTDVEGNSAAVDVYDVFESAFPDRLDLTRATGWSAATIAEIDAYRASALHMAFPTRAMFETIAAPKFGLRWIDVGTYPLAARCPLVVLTR